MPILKEKPVFAPQCWENGIILCRELADQYESYYDYRNLSKMRVSALREIPPPAPLPLLRVLTLWRTLRPGQMMEASLYDKIMDQQRLEPEFFRVGFYGKKFPFFLRVRDG